MRWKKQFNRMVKRRERAAWKKEAARRQFDEDEVYDELMGWIR
jgi:hypothetical protein